MAMINIRVSEAEKAELQERSGGNVSEYARSFLFGKIHQENQLDAVLRFIEDARSPAQSSGATSVAGIDQGVKAILIELLLLMRSSVKAERRAEAKAEVERLGYEPWSYENGANHG